MPWVLNQIRFPPAFDAVSNAFSFFDLHILRVTSLECVVSSWRFYHVLMVSTVSPIVASIILYAATELRVKWVQHFAMPDVNSEAHLDEVQAQLEALEPGPPTPDATDAHPRRVSFGSSLQHKRARLEIKRAKAIRQIRSQGIFLWLLLSFLIYPSVSTQIFQFFSCQKFRGFDNKRGNERVLQIDYSISCRSDDYKAMRIYALYALIIYPVGSTSCMSLCRSLLFCPAQSPSSISVSFGVAGTP